MWPFKSNIPTLEQITTENDGNTITLVLSKGAHKFSKEELLDLRLTSDAFSPKIKNHPNKTLFWGLPLVDSPTLQVITFLLFGGFLNLFILYFYSLYFFEKWGNLILCALPFTLICTICVYLFFCYLLKCFQVAKRKDHPELDLYFEDIVTISLNNCVIQFRMTDQNLDYFYDTTKDATTFGFLINKRKKLVEKVDNSRLEIFGFLFLLLFSFTALYFFWETPFWYWTFLEVFSEFNNRIFETSAFYQSHESMFQFSNYYQSNEISFLRVFFDGMVSNLISISLIIGILIIILIIIVLFLITWTCFMFVALCVYLIIIQIFAYFYLNSKLHRFLSKRGKGKFAATLGIGLIISLLLALLSIYLGIVYLLAFDYSVNKNMGMHLTSVILPFFTYLVLQFFLRKTAFAKKSRAGFDQFGETGLDSLFLPLFLFLVLSPIRNASTSLYNKYGIDVKETESSEKI